MLYIFIAHCERPRVPPPKHELVRIWFTSPYIVLFLHHIHLKIKKMSAVRSFINVFILVSLPFFTDASFAHNSHHHPNHSSAPSVFKTAPTGTGFSTAARNHMFLTSPYEGYVIAGASLTTPSTPWVNGLDVIVSEIPFVEGQVYWNPEFKT